MLHTRTAPRVVVERVRNLNAKCTGAENIFLDEKAGAMWPQQAVLFVKAK